MYCLDSWEANKVCICRKYHSELFFVDYCGVLKLHCYLHTEQPRRKGDLIFATDLCKIVFLCSCCFRIPSFRKVRERSPHRYELLWLIHETSFPLQIMSTSALLWGYAPNPWNVIFQWLYKILFVLLMIFSPSMLFAKFTWYIIQHKQQKVKGKNCFAASIDIWGALNMIF